MGEQNYIYIQNKQLSHIELFMVKMQLLESHLYQYLSLLYYFKISYVSPRMSAVWKYVPVNHQVAKTTNNK